MDDESIAMTMKNSPVPILKVVAETPELPQGETTAKPMPTPKEIRTRVIDKDAAAPASTAAQDTPATDSSVASTCAVTGSASAISSAPMNSAQGMRRHPESSAGETFVSQIRL